MEKKIRDMKNNLKAIKPKDNLDELFLLIEQGLKIFNKIPAPKKKIEYKKILL